ncbi:MAG: anti-sigma factor [Planctomycetota bacterium]
MSDDLRPLDDAELERALAQLDDPSLEGEPSELELAAGEALWGWLGDAPPLDPALEARVLRDADAFFAPRPPRAHEPGLGPRGWGWLVAALVLTGLGLSRVLPAPRPPAPVGLPERLANAPDRVRLRFTPTEAGQADYGAVSGEVVWSRQQQAGFMTFRGLPANRPELAQYQLWIVDPGRDAHPIDGGVFDVTSAGEVVIPIDAKLRVDDAQAFAITLEQPGGVVVSQGPLLLVATP